MENSQHSRITYPEFENNIGTIWRELQQEKDFCDMTLGCNGRRIYAHKAIISACSPVLRNILKQNLEKAPFIYLRGIKKTNLNNLLNFMYQGEVKVFEKDLGGSHIQVTNPNEVSACGCGESIQFSSAV